MMKILRQMAKINLKRKQSKIHNLLQVTTSRSALNIDGSEVNVGCNSLDEENWSERSACDQRSN